MAICAQENDFGCLEPVGDIMVEGEENNSACLDTVGAIVVDREGNVAAAVSSGGLAMKHPGRVGQVTFDWLLNLNILYLIMLYIK